MPPKLPSKRVWDYYRKHWLGITDEQRRDYITRLKFKYPAKTLDKNRNP